MTKSWMSVVPFAFVLLWSTGFIGARFGLPYIEPFNYLFIKNASYPWVRFLYSYSDISRLSGHLGMSLNINWSQAR